MSGHCAVNCDRAIGRSWPISAGDCSNAGVPAQARRERGRLPVRRGSQRADRAGIPSAPASRKGARVHDAGLRTDTDAAVLEWAARNHRVVVSHDHHTMRARADERLTARRAMAGLILVPQDYSLGSAIEDLVLISDVIAAEGLRDLILFLPP